MMETTKTTQAEPAEQAEQAEPAEPAEPAEAEQAAQPTQAGQVGPAFADSAEDPYGLDDLKDVEVLSYPWKRRPGRPKGSKDFYPRRRASTHLKEVAALAPQDRIAVKALASGSTLAEAARTSGMSKSMVFSRLNDDNPAGQKFRAALLATMEKLGIDDASLLSTLKNALEAKSVKWNPKSRVWDSFEDHQTRISAAKLGLELKGAFPKESQAVTAVIFKTDVFADTDDGTVLDELPVVTSARQPGLADGAE